MSKARAILLAACLCGIKGTPHSNSHCVTNLTLIVAWLPSLSFAPSLSFLADAIVGVHVYFIVDSQLH